MEKKCHICGDFIQEDELCDSCLEFFKQKYPDKEDFDRVLQWHKKNAELNQES